MSIQQLLIAKVGSQASGTAILGVSDVDYKAIYKQSPESIVCGEYRQQIEHNKDFTGFEVRRFFELAQTANPTMLELMFTDESMLEWANWGFYNLLQKVKHKFLTKKCFESFIGYAVQQIKKARGLNKKIRWESERIKKKNPIDFCNVVLEKGGVSLLEDWLWNNALVEISVGLCKLNHTAEGYQLYLLENSGRGITAEDSTKLKTISVPHNAVPIATVLYNANGYTQHCKDYASYQTWLKERNVARYVDNGKNQFSYDCYLDSETEYLTSQGWKKYDDVLDIDLIASVDKENNLIYLPIKSRIKKKYSGDIYYYENRYTRFAVTDKHNIWASWCKRGVDYDYS